METAIYFLIWAGAIFLMMRFGCGAHIMGHGHGSGKHGEGSGGQASPRWVAPKTDNDPVCGMSVNTSNAKSAVHDGNVFYFCSRDCREQFEAAPDSYIAAPGSEPMIKEQHHG